MSETHDSPEAREPADRRAAARRNRRPRRPARPRRRAAAAGRAGDARLHHRHDRRDRRPLRRQPRHLRARRRPAQHARLAPRQGALGRRPPGLSAQDPHRPPRGAADDPQVRGPRPVLLGLRVRARHHGRRPRLDLDRLRGRPQGGDAQGDRRGRQGGRGHRRRGADRRRRLRGAARGGRPADPGGDRPQRQRDVDLTQRRRALALLQPGAPQPAPLPRPRGGRGPAHQAAARPRQADRAARAGDQVGDQGLLGAGPLLRGARPRLPGRDRRPRRPRPARGAAGGLRRRTPGRRPHPHGQGQGLRAGRRRRPRVDGEMARRQAPLDRRPQAGRDWSRCASRDSPASIAPERLEKPPRRARRPSTRRSSARRWSPKPSATSG